MTEHRSAETGRDPRKLNCPSANPDWKDAEVFGVVGGSAEEPRVGYLTRRLPVTQAVLALTGPIPAAQVLRFTAPCAKNGCTHFRSGACTLAQRVVKLLPEVTSTLPPCTIRSECRWFHQEGEQACHVCPRVVTQQLSLDPVLHAVATPPGRATGASERPRAATGSEGARVE